MKVLFLMQEKFKENIGEGFTVADGINWAKIDFFEEVCDRFL